MMTQDWVTRSLRGASLAPTLRFGPSAWAKLIFLRDRGDTEVGGFGVSPSDDPLRIEDFHLVEQSCTSVSVRFDDQAVADYFDRQVDRGLQPSNFARVWVHSHPGTSAQPSWTDEETFDRVFGATDWAVMFILARRGQTYARLRFNAGPGGALVVPVAVDYSWPFPASDFEAWDREYEACLHKEPELLPVNPRQRSENAVDAASEPLDAESWPNLGDERLFEQDWAFYEERSIYDR